MSDYSKEDRKIIAKYHLYLFTANNIVQPSYDIGYRAATGHLPNITKDAEVLDGLVERNISFILRIVKEVEDVEQKPSIGRIIHYVDDNQECCAALIVSVGQTLTLKIFNQLGSDLIARKVAYSEEKQVGTWHWPERVE